MARSDLDHARELLSLAGDDFTALGNMLDPALFPESVFGFHAQQAIEKALKAWLASQKREYRKTHDLADLVDELRLCGADVARFERLEAFTIFAVQVRYERFLAESMPLDRCAVVASVDRPLSHVAALVRPAP